MRFLEFLMLFEQDIVSLQNLITQGETELTRLRTDASRKAVPLEKKIAGLKRQLSIAQRNQVQQTQAQQNATPGNNQSQ